MNNPDNIVAVDKVDIYAVANKHMQDLANEWHAMAQEVEKSRDYDSGTQAPLPSGNLFSASFHNPGQMALAQHRSALQSLFKKSAETVEEMADELRKNADRMENSDGESSHDVSRISKGQ